jgi:hypothetical protein
MSWGTGEFPGETALDPMFTTPGVVYFASTGDGPGTQYPSLSPNMVAVGGTTLSWDPITGNFRFENTWQSRRRKQPVRIETGLSESHRWAGGN